MAQGRTVKTTNQTIGRTAMPHETKTADMYMHSRCCMAHWELVQRGHNVLLECERCGAPGLWIAKVYDHKGNQVDPPIARACENCGDKTESLGWNQVY